MKKIRENVTKLLFTADSPHYEDLLSYDEMKFIVKYNQNKLNDILHNNTKLHPHDLNCILYIAAINQYIDIVNSVLSDTRFVHPDEVELKYFKQKMITDIVKHEFQGEINVISPDTIRGAIAETMDDILSRFLLFKKDVRFLKYLLIQHKITTYVRSGEESVLNYAITPESKEKELLYVLRLLDGKYLIHYTTPEKIATCDKCGNTKLADILRSK